MSWVGVPKKAVLKETELTWICRECKEIMPKRRKEFDGYCEKCYD